MATILIIEDNVTLARAIANKFPAHNCFIAYSYASAEDIYEENKEDIGFVISDLQIPPTGLSPRIMCECHPFYSIPFINQLIRSDFKRDNIVIYSGYTDLIKNDPRPSVSITGIKMIQKNFSSLNELERYVNSKL